MTHWMDLVFAALPLLILAAYRSDFFRWEGEPEIGFDPDATEWTIGNSGIRRSVRFDRERGGLAPGILCDARSGGRAGARVVSEGEIHLEGPDPIALGLDRGWSLLDHTADDGALSIRLGAVHQPGVEVTVVYRAQPGDEPVIARRILFHNRSDRPLMLREMVVDRYESTGPRPEARAYAGSGLAVSEGGRGPGYAVAVLHWQGRGVVEEGGARVSAVYAPNIMAPPDQTISGPWSVLGLFDGPPETGAFLLQLHVGSHVSHATPTTVPPLYSTWFGYYMDIDEGLVRHLIPLAAGLGVKSFCIDDGWQALADGETWGYGDWAEDRLKFPGGLAAIGEEVRGHGMRFGLWTAPIMAANTSRMIDERPEWLVRQGDGSRKPLYGDNSAMCFTGACARHFTRGFVRLARELGLGSVKIDGSLFVDGCTAPGHEHPEGFSEGAQVAAWGELVSALREAVPGIVVDRGWEAEPGLTALQDTSWFGDWATAFRPDREADPRWWYRNADIYRRALYTLAANRPPFTLSWETPCHIPTDPVDLDALEYHFTSIGAYICNVELHGRLDETTPEEADLLRKWVRWNEENREWLAYSQPIASLGRPYDALDDAAEPHIDGVLHLRNALRGRYGYACVWNPADRPDTARVTIRPSDYFVRMDTSRARALRIKDGSPVELERAEDAITLRIPMAPLSWEIVEIIEG